MMKRKKGTKRFAALLVTAMLAMGMVPTAAFAANDSLPPANGNLHIHKYLMADLSDAEQPNDGTEAGTGTNPAVPNSATPLDNIKFDIYQVAANANGDYPGAKPYRLTGTTLTDGAGDTFTVTQAAAPNNTVTTDSAGLATANGLPQGVYLVVEQSDPRVTTPADPFVVAVPMTNAAGDGWLTDVHVYPKNESASATKELTPDGEHGITDGNGSAITVGSQVSYTINTSIPAEIYVADNATEDANIKYVVTDTLDSALTFIPASVEVYGVTAAETAADPNAPLTGGTLIPAAANYTVGKDANNKDFTITLTDAGRKLVSTSNYKTLRIVFKATVNSEVFNKVNHEFPNQATVDFTNKWGSLTTTETTKVEVHTGAIDILKKDATDNSVVLAGAKFKISDSDANARAAKYAKVPAADKNSATPTDIVFPSDSRYAGLTGYEDWELTTDAAGKVMFQGMRDYTSVIAADGTETKTYLKYYLVETVAPNGFNLPADPFEVEFTATNSTPTLGYTVSQDIFNTNEFVLPLTGGTGALIFTIAGVALVGLGGIMLMMNRKKKANQK